MDELRRQNDHLLQQLKQLQSSFNELAAQLKAKDEVINNLTMLVQAQHFAIPDDPMDQDNNSSNSDSSSSTSSSPSILEIEDDIPAPSAQIPQAPPTPNQAPPTPTQAPPTPTPQPTNDGFVTVSHKKRRPSTPESTPVAFKKAKNRPAVSKPSATPQKIQAPKPTVVNKTIIPSIDNIDDMGNYASNPPAITLLKKSNWDAISQQLNRLKVTIVKAKFFPDCMKFIVQKPEHYRSAVKFLSGNKIEFYSHPLNEEKDIRVVIRNVDTTISDESIINQLKEAKLPVLSVRRMCNSTRLFPMVSVHLENSIAGRSIYGLTKLSHASVTVEKQKPSTRQPQCHKCQRFGHSSQRCNVAARCVKCAGPHLTAHCTRKNPETDGPPTCCNCGEAHTANYRGCAKYPKPSYATVTKPAPPAVQPQAPKATPRPPKKAKKATPTPTKKPSTKPTKKTKSSSTSSKRKSTTSSPPEGSITQDLTNPKFLELLERLEKLAPLIHTLKSLNI